VKEILLINVSGENKRDIISAVTSVLARYSVNILDVSQSVFHDTLSLGILAEVPQQHEDIRILNEVISNLQYINLVHLQVQTIAEKEYMQWVSDQGKPRHIVTVLARVISAEHVARISEATVAQGLIIESITRLSSRISLEAPNSKSMASIEFSIGGHGQNIADYRASLLKLSAEMNIDIAYQEDSIYRRHRRLVVFDMDSTLIESEVIDELAREAGVGEEVAEITARAMAGELDFKNSFRQRVAKLKGLDMAVLDKVASELKLSEGAEVLMGTLKSLGYKTAILSGGFTFFGEKIRDHLGIDYLYANTLDVKDGLITGEVRGAIVDGQRKAELLTQLATRENVRIEQTVAVGDGANDLPMLSIAGLGIAYRAKPVVRASAKQAISNIGLDGILYLMGIRDGDAI
jgi:phosphoserine phosphatase